MRFDNVKLTTVDVRRWVDDWVERSDEWFRRDDIWKHYNIVTRNSKDAVWHRLDEHIATGVLEKDGYKYRRVQQEFDEIDIFNKGKFIDLMFPFELEKYIRITRKSVMIVGGSKDSWKTGFLLKTALLNMGKHIVIFHDSESGEALLYERIISMMPDIDNPLPFKIVSIMEHFDDLVRVYPDAVHIIDYLDIESEFYLVGNEVSKILSKLGTGVAIIGLQKPPSRDLPYGGSPAIRKAQAVVILDRSKAKILHAKSRTNSSINPVNKTWTFQYTDKGDVMNIQTDGIEPEEPTQIPF